MFYSVICESNLLQYKHLGVYPINRIDPNGLWESDAQSTSEEPKDLIHQLNSSLINMRLQKLELSNDIEITGNYIGELKREKGYLYGVMMEDTGFTVLQAIFLPGDPTQIISEGYYELKETQKEINIITDTIKSEKSEIVLLENQVEALNEIMDIVEDQLSEF